jgi:hypothetical protein
MDFDLLTAFVEPGMILKRGRYFLLVITKDRHDSGFYYCRCDWYGNPIKEWGDRVSAANYINHSNMILVSDDSDRIEVVNQRDVDTRTVFSNCKRYTWHLIGDKAIDQKMANLDARWELFYDTATTEDMSLYSRQEDRNNHSENADFVAAFGLLRWNAKRNEARKMRIKQRSA